MNISYPMKVVEGRLQTSTGPTAIADQINNVVDTRFGERVMRPEFGIKDYIFSVGSPTVALSDIERSIQQWIPSPPIRLKFRDASVEKSLIIDVEFDYDGQTLSGSSLAL